MIELVLTPSRKIIPATPDDVDRCRRLKGGTALSAHAWADRNVKQNRWWQVFLRVIADNHPTARNPKDVHTLIKLAAHFGDWVVDTHGESTFRERSTAFGECTQVEFDDYLKAAVPIAEQMLGDINPEALRAQVDRESAWRG